MLAERRLRVTKLAFRTRVENNTNNIVLDQDAAVRNLTNNGGVLQPSGILRPAYPTYTSSVRRVLSQRSPRLQVAYSAAIFRLTKKHGSALPLGVHAFLSNEPPPMYTTDTAAHP